MKVINNIEDFPKCSFCGHGIRPDKFRNHVSNICNKRVSPNEYSEVLTKRCVPNWIVKIANENRLPETLPLLDILSDSCYYPCSGYDTSPVFITNGHIHSFVYCDYNLTPNDYQNAYGSSLFKGYQKIFSRTIEKKEILPVGWKTKMPINFYTSQGSLFLEETEKNWNSMGEWSIWKINENFNGNIGPDYFSFMFIAGEALKTYIELYIKNSLTPAVIVLINPGGQGKGGNNWIDLTNKEGLFWKTIKSRGNPNYIIDNGFGLKGNKIECPFKGYNYVGSVLKEKKGISKFINEKRLNIYLGDSYYQDLINIYKCFPKNKG